MNKNADFETVWEIKEKLCYIPDGRVIKIGTEGFRAPEALFSTELIEVEGDGKADMVFRCIQEMDIDNIMLKCALLHNRSGEGSASKVIKIKMSQQCFHINDQNWTGILQVASISVKIADFRVGKILVLIATDVIAHGMDFKGVNCVINYDFPDSAAAYIHRIGRSGRAGRSGEAISFYAEDDIPFLRNIANVMEASGCEVPSWIKALPKLRGKKHRPRRESISTKPKDKTEGEANQKVTKGEEASPTKSFDFNQTKDETEGEEASPTKSFDFNQNERQN
ncbi:hypothetical protein Q3G72_008443 [Acer saccharum]|nr:hypothetical protein Q3G72_008443 [Acer saccharum]